MFCKACGSWLPDNAVTCKKCSAPTGAKAAPAAARDIGDDPMMRMILPVGRSGYAIAAGYLGLFAVLLVPAPLALLFGILAIRHLKRDPKKHGMGRAIFGLVMGAAGTVGLLIILVALARG
jgi:hypothetical protein